MAAPLFFGEVINAANNAKNQGMGKLSISYILSIIWLMINHL